MEATSDDSLSSSGLEWENLALYSNKQLPPMQNQQFEMPNDFGKLGYEDMMMRMAGDHSHSHSHPAMSIGLRLGHPHKEVEQFEYGSPDASFSLSRVGNSSSSSIPVSSTPTPTKRSRASYHNMQNPCCQVEGCNLDLKLAKDYHRRHRICDSHSKSPKVIVAGMERRFCQQCSRFHDLSEFDDKKRSCRRRLSDHNARRRRVQPESIQLTSPGRISSALYSTDERHQNVLLNGLPVSMPNSISCWENANANAMTRHAHLVNVRPSKSTLLNDDVLHIDTDNRLTSLHRSTPRNINLLDQCVHVGSSNCSSMAPELLGAHSFLSSSSWSLHDGESTSMEGINYSTCTAMRHSETTTDSSHNFTLFQNTNIGGALDHEPPAAAASSSSSFLHMQNINAAASSHQQEYQLFKPPNYQYSPAGNFYSSQRS